MAYGVIGTVLAVLFGSAMTASALDNGVGLTPAMGYNT